MIKPKPSSSFELFNIKAKKEPNDGGLFETDPQYGPLQYIFSFIPWINLLKLSSVSKTFQNGVEHHLTTSEVLDPADDLIYVGRSHNRMKSVKTTYQNYLHLAIKKDNERIVELILSKKRFAGVTRQRNTFFLGFEKSRTLVKRFSYSCFDPTPATLSISPLQQACHLGNPKILDLLLTRIAEFRERKETEFEDFLTHGYRKEVKGVTGEKIFDDRDWADVHLVKTPLMQCASKGWLEGTKKLAEFNRKFKVFPDSKFVCRGVMFQGNEMMEGEVDCGTYWSKKQTPISAAKKAGNGELVKFLVSMKKKVSKSPGKAKKKGKKGVKKKKR